MRALWLMARSRIGMKHFRFVQPEPIERACIRRRESGEVSVILRFEPMKASRCIRIRGRFQNEIDPFRFRSPDSEVRLSIAAQLCSDGIAP